MLLYFLQFLSNLDKMWKRRCPLKSIQVLPVSWKSAQQKPQYTLGYKCFYMCTFYNNCPTWVKFSTKNVNIMLLSNFEFWENQCKEGQTSLVSINKITLTHALTPFSASPLHSHHSSIIPHLAKAWQHFVVTITAVTVTTTMGTLLIPDSPKTWCHFHFYFFSGMIIPGLLWVRTKKSELTC